MQSKGNHKQDKKPECEKIFATDKELASKIYKQFTQFNKKKKPQVCFPPSSVGKNLPANAGDLDWEDPGLGRSPGEGNGNSLQYSCLENAMDEGAW